MSSFTTPFHVRVHNVPMKEKPFEITRGFEFYSERFEGLTVKVPIGYRTDLASIPKIFWGYLPPCGRYSKASVMHDVLIDSVADHELNYHKINQIFLEAMEVSGVNIIKRYSIFLGLEFYWSFGIKISTFIRKMIGKKLK